MKMLRRILFVLVLFACALSAIMQPGNTPPAAPAPTADLDAMSDEELIRYVARQTVGNRFIEARVNPTAFMVDFRRSGEISRSEREAGRIGCALRETGRFDGLRYQAIAMGDFVDAMGNETVDVAYRLRIDGDVLANVNCSNAGSVRWGVIGSEYVHPGVNDDR